MPTRRRPSAILTGAGGTFCAGADLKAVAAGDRRPVHDAGPGPMGPTRHDPVQAGDRGGGGLRGRRRPRAGHLVRPAGGGRGRGLRGLLPAFRGAAGRPRDRAAPPADRGQPGDGHDPHRSGRVRPRGAGDGLGQPPLPARPGPSRRPSSSPSSWPRSPRAACAATGARRSSSGGSRRRTPRWSRPGSAARCSSSGESMAGAQRFSSGEGRGGAAL